MAPGNKDGTLVHGFACIFLSNILKTCADKVNCVKEGAIVIEKIAVIRFHVRLLQFLRGLSKIASNTGHLSKMVVADQSRRRA